MTQDGLVRVVNAVKNSKLKASHILHKNAGQHTAKLADTNGADLMTRHSVLRGK